jgi:hypothetical protein
MTTELLQELLASQQVRKENHPLWGFQFQSHIKKQGN